MLIKPYSKNAKKHPQKQVEQVAESIKRFGMNQPIVVDKDGVIIVGHGRYLALQHLGWEIKPEYIKQLTDLTPEEVNAYRLADNKLNESEWDMNLVVEELKGLSEEMLELTGFDSDLIIEPDEKDDEVPEIPEEPHSKLGDLYELGNHRVLCGDSTKIDDVERLMDGKKADMVFTDPPYGMNLDTDYSSMSERSKKHTAVIGDDTPYDPTPLFDMFGYCKEILLFGADYYLPRIPNWQNGCWLIWDKRVSENYDKVIGSSYEVLWSKKPRRKEILRYEYVSWQSRMADGKKTHPTMKPVGLLSRIITWLEDKGIVVDLFLGSGSTLIASEKTGRICYGMELDEKYIDVIIERWCQFTGIRNIKKNGQDYYWEAKQ